jgi:hypothetical protein
LSRVGGDTGYSWSVGKPAVSANSSESMSFYYRPSPSFLDPAAMAITQPGFSPAPSAFRVVSDDCLSGNGSTPNQTSTNNHSFNQYTRMSSSVPQPSFASNRNINRVYQPPPEQPLDVILRSVLLTMLAHPRAGETSQGQGNDDIANRRHSSGSHDNTPTILQSSPRKWDEATMVQPTANMAYNSWPSSMPMRSAASAFNASSGCTTLSLPQEKPSMATFCLSCPNMDSQHLSQFQVFLRMHIEAFGATVDDTTSHTRGRNKSIVINQVGIRCRHCAHIPPGRRAKGSTYFPASTLGFYQAAQNMCSTHLQCGLCPEMPDSVKTMFAQLLSTKTAGSSSSGGRAYWGKCAQDMGQLVDTEHGIFPRFAIPDGTNLLEAKDQTFYQSTASAKKLSSPSTSFQV